MNNNIMKPSLATLPHDKKLPPRTSDPHAEEALNSALLADPNTIIAVRDKLTWRDYHTERQRIIAQAIWSCIDLTPPLIVNRANVLSQLRTMGYGEDVMPAAYLQQLDDMGTTPVVAGAQQYADRIVLLSRGRKLAHRARQFAQDIAVAPDDAASLTEALMGGVMTDMSAAIGDRESTAAAILDEETEKPTPAFPTGFKWVDSLVGGFRPAEIWSVAGRYKGRKTTLALGWLLRALRAGMSCSYFITEGTRLQLLRRLVAMLATGRMRVQGVPVEQWTLDGKGLAEKLRTPEQHEAIEWARGQVRQMPLRVYDGRDKVQTLEGLIGLVRRDIVMHHCQIAVLDYIQQVRPVKRGNGQWQDSPFERSVEALQNLTTGEQITSIVLSQRNESKNRSKDDDRTAGTKGGGALAAASDFYFETEYDEFETPTYLTVALRFTRYSGIGEHIYTINPSSGLILDPASLPGGIYATADTH